MVQAEPGAVTLVCNKVLGLGGDGSSPCIPNATSLFLATFDSPEVEDLGLVMELLFFVRTPCPPPPPVQGGCSSFRHHPTYWACTSEFALIPLAILCCWKCAL